jgi:Flp pilus assembly protein TadG
MQQERQSDWTKADMNDTAPRRDWVIRLARAFHTRTNPDRHCRSGLAMLEMALVLPLFLFLAFGMVEFGQYMYMSHILDSACRDAARAAIPETAVAGDPAAAATRTLNLENIPYASVTLLIQDVSNSWVTVTDCSTVPAGHNLYVELLATYSQLPNVYRPFNDMTGHGISNSKVIQSTCTMTKE